MGWKLTAGQRADNAAANRKAALQSLATRYGGLARGFQDVYGDLTPEIQEVARKNPLSETARLERSYGESTENLRRQLAARGALQSGDLGYGLGQLDFQHSADLYDLGNAFTSSAQQYINDYVSILAGLNQEQIQAIQAAAQMVRDRGYRLGGEPAPGETVAPADQPVVNPPTASRDDEQRSGERPSRSRRRSRACLPLLSRSTGRSGNWRSCTPVGCQNSGRSLTTC